jgi:hypothetical protein
MHALPPVWVDSERALNFSLAVVERGTFLLSAPSCAWKTTEATVRAVASSALRHAAHPEWLDEILPDH